MSTPLTECNPDEYATLPVWMREDDLSGWKSSLYVWRRGNAD